MTTSAGDLLRASGLPLLDARALLAYRLGVPRERLVAHPDEPIDAPDADAFLALARRRAAGEPLAYLLGEKEFYGRPFEVNGDVLVPRPETELLVERALDQMRPLARPRVLDLGTGSGCIAISLALECPGARVTAVDCSPAALAVARRNAVRLGADVEFRLGDWYAGWPSAAAFDFIVSNPPYVDPSDPHLDDLRFEPRAALTDEQDGLACLTRVVTGATTHLAQGGWLMVEHGYDQSAAVQELFARSGLVPMTCNDAAGHPRVTVGRRREAPV